MPKETANMATATDRKTALQSGTSQEYNAFLRYRYSNAPPEIKKEAEASLEST